LIERAGEFCRGGLLSDGIETDLERTQGSPERSSYFLQRRLKSRSNRFLFLGFRFRFLSCKKGAVFVMVWFLVFFLDKIRFYKFWFFFFTCMMCPSEVVLKEKRLFLF